MRVGWTDAAASNATDAFGRIASRQQNSRVRCGTILQRHMAEAGVAAGIEKALQVWLMSRGRVWGCMHANCGGAARVTRAGPEIACLRRRRDTRPHLASGCEILFADGCGCCRAAERA